MFVLSSSVDNAVFGHYNNSVPISREYPRQLVGKIPMPTFDLGRSFCCACNDPIDHNAGQDVYRKEWRPSLRGWITSIAGTFTHIVHKDLWSMFPKDQTNGFVAGKVFDAHGEPIEDWVSLSGKCVVVRNSIPVYYGICSGCGSFFYDGIGSQYVCFEDNGKCMFKTTTGFLLSSKYSDCFDLGELKRHHVRIEHVKYLRKPKDGLPPIIPYRHTRPAIELVDWLSSLICNIDIRQPDDSLFDDLAALCDKIRAVRLDPVRLIESCLAKASCSVKDRLNSFLSLPSERQSLRAYWWIPGHVYPEDMNNLEYEDLSDLI